MSESKASRRGGSLGFVVGLVIGIPATMFALSNLESVDVEFLGWEASVPLWIVIIVALIAGALVGCAVLLAAQARRRRGKKKAARTQAKADQERETQQAEADQGPESEAAPSSDGSAAPESPPAQLAPRPPGRVGTDAG